MDRSRRAVLLIATVLAWAAFAPSAHAIGWLPGPTFGDGTLAGFGGVATDDAGFSTVVWVEGDDDAQTIYAQRVALDGTRGPRQALGSGEVAQVRGTAAGAVVTWAQPTATDGEYDVKVAWIGADGTVAAVRTAAGQASEDPPAVAVEPDGDAFVAWTSYDAVDDDVFAHARRIAADGTFGPIADLGASFGFDPTRGPVDVAVSGDGGARVAWIGEPEPDSDDYAVWVARLDAAGTVDGTTAIPVGAAQPTVPTLDGGAGGAVAAWFEPISAGGMPTARVQVVRLPSSGAVATAPVTIVDSVAMFFAQLALVVSPDGTATIGYSDLDPVASAGRVVVRRLSAAGAVGPETTLSGVPAVGQLDLMPQLAEGVGGSVIAVWASVNAAGGGIASAASLVSRVIAPDGTSVGAPSRIPGVTLSQIGQPFVWLAGSASGNAIVGTFVYPVGVSGSPPPSGVATALLDSVPPVVSVSIPASVQRGVDATFSATATDVSGITSFVWDFGDGSFARGATVTHAYGRAGSYPVTVTVADTAGNETVTTRTIAVTEPAVVPPGGGGPPTPPGPASTGLKARAQLKLTRVARGARAVTVAGTLDRRASGRVTISWTQRSGRRSIKRTATARISRGRFAATIRLTGRLAGLRTIGTLTVVYAGDADTERGRVAKSLRAPRRAGRRAAKRKAR